MPKVSVIIPNYNHERYLEKRIESVLHQTYQDFEIILMDDASTDNSLKILEKYKNNHKISICVNKKNSGSSFKQWKKGVSAASGEFIWIAESDDLADPDFLSTCISAFQASPNLVLVYCQSYFINFKGDVVELATSWTDDLDCERWKRDFITDGKSECISYLSVKNTIPNASAVVFRKETFDSIDTNIEMRLCGDWVIWSRIMKQGDIAFISKPLNFFRTHNNNVRSTTSKKLILKEHLAAIKDVADVKRMNIAERKILAKKLYLNWQNFIDLTTPYFSFRYVLFLSSISHYYGAKFLYFMIRSMLSSFLRQFKSP